MNITLYLQLFTKIKKIKMQQKSKTFKVAIFIFIYFFSSYHNYKWNNAWFGKDGKLEGCNPDFSDFIGTYIPILNSAALISEYFINTYKDERKTFYVYVYI